MPKLDLTSVLAIKALGGRLKALKGAGFAWEAFDPASLFADGTIGALWSVDAMTPQTLGTEALLMPDLSGNGYNATGATGTAMTYEVDSSGKPYLKGTGNKFMSFAIAAYGSGAPVEIMAACALDANGSYPIILGSNSGSTGAFFGFGAASGTDRKPRISLAGGTGGAVTLLGTTAAAIGVPLVMSARYYGGTLAGAVSGVDFASSVRSGTFGVPGEGRIGFTGFATSPIRFYGGIIIRKQLTTEERFNLTSWFSSLIGASAPPVPVGPDTVYALGDSTVTEYLGQASLLSLLTSSYAEVNLAVAGNTVSQQATAWANYNVLDTTPKWVVIQAGLNDLNPAEAASALIGRLQALVEDVRSRAGAGCKIFISQMIPCKARLISVYGETNGLVSYQKWLDTNAAIAGSGATPITGVDGRVTSHVSPMSDGSGNLAAAYDTGDGIHPNTAGRQINADAWVAALTAAGVTV